AIKTTKISGMIRPAEEEEPAVSSMTTTGAISIIGSETLPAKAVEATPANAAASANVVSLFLQVIARGKISEV
ncbi:MAG: hypothetical protein QMC33_12305, partial [Octadecabacter sp.]